ncbi:competence protein [[Synechococcus] sp. NIES-970]|nr:competence protein [[Synechococcus] sp. NIES-970]
MTFYRGILLCLGYILGLGLTGFWGPLNPRPDGLQWGMMVSAIAFVTMLATVFLPRYFWQLPRRWWPLFGLVVLLAVGYGQVRLPRPAANGLFALTQAQPNLLQSPVEIRGEIYQTTNSADPQHQRFWLRTTEVRQGQNVAAPAENLYVTLTGDFPALHRGDRLQLTGRLYAPRPPQNRFAFSFPDYLRQRNTFLGFSAWEADLQRRDRPISDRIRQRIQRSHGQFLAERPASLLSSMVLGRQAANLDREIYDLWVKAGLAYTVAASGFHVSLLLGLVLWLLRDRAVKIQFAVAAGVLLGYVLLTGLQPSILRAALMGMGGLVALLLDRQVKPISLLLVTATVLLLINPLWLWDLGFQLSFLATFGLFTTLEPIQKKLDFLPLNVATAIAIPIAASLWTLPLLAYQFNVIASYSVFTSIVLSPAIALVSLGGMISGFLGLLSPQLGGAIAYILVWPLGGMIWLVERVVALPGAQMTVAALHWSQLLVFYGVMLLIWRTKWAQKRFVFLSASLLTLFIVLLIYRHFNTTQVTIFSDRQTPVIVAQARGKTVVINGGSSGFWDYNLVPFLRRNGISQIEALVNFTATDQELPETPQTFPIQQSFTLEPETNPEAIALRTLEPQRIGAIDLQLLQENVHLLEIRLQGQSFYLLAKQNPEADFIAQWNPGILIAQPSDLDAKIWQTLRPQRAIAIGSPQGHFLAPNAIVHWTATEGTLQWTPQRGLSSLAPTNF